MTFRFVCLAAFATFAPPVLAQEPAAPIEIWQSSYGDENRIALEAETLLTELDATHALAYEPVFDPIGKPVETLMREQGRFVGAFFPGSVDQMVCRANPELCSVDENGATAWTNKSLDTLNLPAVTFQPTITFGSAEKPIGITVDELWSPTLDCSALGIKCSDAVNALNQNNPIAYDRNTAGIVTVPQLAYQAEITSQALTAPAIDSWSDVRSAVQVENFVAKGPGGSFFSSFSGEPDFTHQRQLFELIGFPWPDADPKSVPEAYERKVRIGVADGWLDAGQREFGGRIPVLSDEGAVDLGPMCGTASISELCDHATHVVGIIAAAVDDHGIAGLNPFADVTVRRADIHNVQDPSVGAQLANALFLDAVGGKVDLFNLSWGYPKVPGKDQLAAMMTDTLKDRLFIVAAGNTNDGFNIGACGILPACLNDAPNVLSVVGLDRNLEHPALWKKDEEEGSNWNVDFHVGAIARDVLSTVSGNRVDTLSGTSQAAPQVTATAAYIISAYRDYRGTGAALPPVEVKNRLIYTADVFPELLSAVAGGRLNMWRALDIKMDQIVLRNGHGKVLRGRLTLLGNVLHDEHVLCRDPLATEIRVVRDQLKRMVQLPDGEYILFAAPPTDIGRDGPVVRIGPCELRTRSNTAQFIVDSEGAAHSKTLTFTIADIVDFTAGMN